MRTPISDLSKHAIEIACASEHPFVEKPISPNLDDADVMIGALDRGRHVCTLLRPMFPAIKPPQMQSNADVICTFAASAE